MLLCRYLAIWYMVALNSMQQGSIYEKPRVFLPGVWYHSAGANPFFDTWVMAECLEHLLQ